MNLLDCTGKFKCKSEHRNTHFVENGGNLLKELISSTHGKINPIRIFTLKELREATNDFNPNMIIGRHLSIIYRGIHDGQLFAVEVFAYHHFFPEMFINEMVSLSQANHRNIQKLIGCCIETKDPMLVGELIPNGSLYERLNEIDASKQLQWASRVRIAIEIADALAYLHTALRLPIMHGNISSQFILVDERLRAKVCNFAFSEMQKDPSKCEQKIGKDVQQFGRLLLELTIGKVLLLDYVSSTWDGILKTATKDIKEEDVPMAKACYELAKRIIIVNNEKERPGMKQIVQELRIISKSIVISGSQ